MCEQETIRCKRVQSLESPTVVVHSIPEDVLSGSALGTPVCESITRGHSGMRMISHPEVVRYC